MKRSFPGISRASPHFDIETLGIAAILRNDINEPNEARA